MASSATSYKTSEGVADLIKLMLREEMTASPLAKAGALLAKSAFAKLEDAPSITPNTVAHPCSASKACASITHGSSNGNAIKNAIRVAVEFAKGDVNRRIESELTQWAESTATSNS